MRTWARASGGFANMEAKKGPPGMDGPDWNQVAEQSATVMQKCRDDGAVMVMPVVNLSGSDPGASVVSLR